MYYFIEILYAISAVSSFSLEIDESVDLGIGRNSAINDTSNSRNLIHNSDSDKASINSLRRNLTHPITRRAKEHIPSLWHSVKSLGPEGEVSMATDELFSSESEDESNSDANFAIPIIKPEKTIARTPKITHKALYKLTRVHSSWTKKYDNGRNKTNETRGRNKRNHKQKKKYIGRQDLNKKHAAVGLYIDNVRQILYNTTHYSPYSEPLHGTYDISDLWNKQQIVKPFDESFKLPLPSNKLKDIISVLGGERHKKKLNNNGEATNLRPKIEKDFIDFHLNTPELSKINAEPGAERKGKHHRWHKSKGKSDGWIFRIIMVLAGKVMKDLKPVIQKSTVYRKIEGAVVSAVNAVKNAFKSIFQKRMKRTLEDNKFITVKTAELFREIEKEVGDSSITLPSEWVEELNNISEAIVEVAIEKPVELIHETKEQISSGNLANEAAKGVDNLLQEQLKPNIDKFKNKLIPGLQQETENNVQTVMNGTTNLWQEQLKPNIELTPNTLQHGNKNVTQAQPMSKGRSNLWQPWIHRVRDDVKVNTFMNQMLRHKLKIFDIIEKQSRDENWKTYIRYLAKTYEGKFKEFIRDTSQHKIKSRMGSERVILNSIDISNRILTRLVNFAMDDMKNKGFLIPTSDITKMIGEKINEETNTVLEQACLNLNACRKRNGFIDFISDFFTIVSTLDSDKFELATNALSAAVKRSDLTADFGPKISKRFKDQITTFDSSPYIFKIGAFNVMKNIVTNSNSPLVVYGDSKDNTDKTVAMLDVMSTLDQKVPVNVENTKQWNNIRIDLNNFAQNRNQNIKTIMSAFVKHIKKVVDGTDEDTKNKILHSVKLFL